MTTHFIGIGGIGMSALARFLLLKKQKVSGSDISLSKNIERLINLGADISLGHKKKDFQGTQLVVYSSAIQQKINEEFLSAKKAKIPLVHRAEFLDSLLLNSKPLLVTGAHGKTSTSALLSWVFMTAKLDPSFIIGGLLKPNRDNSRAGAGDFFIAEADESDGSFLKSNYYGAIITNFDVDHIDYWKNIENLQNAYHKFIMKSPDKDYLFICAEDPFLRLYSNKAITYGFSEHADLKIMNYKQIGLNASFDILFQHQKYININLAQVGLHYVLNASAVFGLCLKFGISHEIIREAFGTFPGVCRRLDHIGTYDDIAIFDDYAHHPQEIASLIESVKLSHPSKRVVAVFQPHRFSRLHILLDRFVASFDRADVCVTTEVYAAGENHHSSCFNEFLQKMSHRHLQFFYFKKSSLITRLIPLLRPKDLVLFIGAGDITTLASKLFNEIKGVKT